MPRWTDPLELNELFLALSPADARALYERIQAAADAARITYEDDDGATHVVPILVRPRVMRREQEAYYHRVCFDLDRAIERLATMYVHDPQIRELLPFTEAEDTWLREV